jgi:hypothetical protein
MPFEPPAVDVTLGALAAGRVCGADTLPVGAGKALLWTEGEGLRGTEPVTSLGAALRDENMSSLAKRAESELQLTRLTASPAVNARPDQESERIGSATLRIGPLTRLHTTRRTS